MSTREKGYAICVENRGAEDLEVRKVYRVLPDKAATATGYMRVIDGSGEDYLYLSRCMRLFGRWSTLTGREG